MIKFVRYRRQSNRFLFVKVGFSLRIIPNTSQNLYFVNSEKKYYLMDEVQTLFKSKKNFPVNLVKTPETYFSYFSR
jgi:hypothetical protein